MPCDQYEQTRFLHAYGELENPTPEFLSHIESCDDCRRDIDQVQQIRDVYHSEPEPSPLPDPVRVHRPTRWVAALAVAAALLFALTGLFLIDRGGPVTPADEPKIEPVAYMEGVEIDEQIRDIHAELVELDFSDDSF